MHSSASDGVMPPAEVVSLARRRGLLAIALTDHDTVAGLVEARLAGERLGVRVIDGVEISCLEGNREIHILGLFVDPGRDSLEELLQKSLEQRQVAARKTISRLKTLGAPVELEDVLRFAKGKSVGRAHFARALVEKGHASSLNDAFSRYLGEGRPARIHRPRPSVGEACRAIREAGGISSLAHPGGKPGLLPQEAVLKMVSVGLDALEAHHPSHDERTRARLERWANNLGLLITGGSDFHGLGEGAEPGRCFVDSDMLRRLEAKRPRAEPPRA